MTADTILVCDPDPLSRRELRVLLRDAGYHVVAAEDGGRALACVAQRRPQALILELMLPDIDGLKLCRQIRAESSMPILVLSANDDERTMVEVLGAGADDYVTRPIRRGELLARLAARLRTAPAELQIEIDGLVIDLSGHLVMADGELVHLTATEFALLRALSTSRGIVTYRALASEVWGRPDGNVVPRIRTHIANLRAKLSRDQPRELIRTVAGTGYFFARPERLRSHMLT